MVVILWEGILSVVFMNRSIDYFPALQGNMIIIVPFKRFFLDQNPLSLSPGLIDFYLQNHFKLLLSFSRMQQIAWTYYIIIIFLY